MNRLGVAAISGGAEHIPRQKFISIVGSTIVVTQCSFYCQMTTWRRNSLRFWMHGTILFVSEPFLLKFCWSKWYQRRRKYQPQCHLQVFQGVCSVWFAMGFNAGLLLAKVAGIPEVRDLKPRADCACTHRWGITDLGVVSVSVCTSITTVYPVVYNTV